MSNVHLLSLAALLSLATATSASSFVVTTDTIGGALVGTTDVSIDISSSFNDDKTVRAAKDDAASFVASRGALRGVLLEAALLRIRQVAPHLSASDEQLAQAILVL